MNILPVWKRGITGKGVVVSILDDGKFHVAVPFYAIPETFSHAKNKINTRSRKRFEL